LFLPFSYRFKLVFFLSLFILKDFQQVKAQTMLLENKGRMAGGVTYTKQLKNGMTYYKKKRFYSLAEK
jgi:hypothetical protein